MQSEHLSSNKEFYQSPSKFSSGRWFLPTPNFIPCPISAAVIPLSFFLTVWPDVDSMHHSCYSLVTADPSPVLGAAVCGASFFPPLCETTGTGTLVWGTNLSRGFCKYAKVKILDRHQANCQKRRKTCLAGWFTRRLVMKNRYMQKLEKLFESANSVSQWELHAGMPRLAQFCSEMFRILTDESPITSIGIF